MHKLVKDIQAEGVYGFQAIRVNVKLYGFFGQFLYRIYKFICRSTVEVARQFQAKTVVVSVDLYSEI
jgi:hypothetical protein